MAEKTDAKGFDKALSAHLLLADFYSDSCVPCKRLSPVLAELEEELEDVRFVKVNAVFESELAERYSVASAPTLILFRDGQEAARLTGFRTGDEIKTMIENVR